jgi:hypothetical protein
LAVGALNIILISISIQFNKKVPAKANKSIVVNNKIKIETDKTI